MKNSTDEREIKYCYVTVLTTQSYLEGCRILYKSLQATMPKYPFVVVCPDNIPKNVTDCLTQLGISYHLAENLNADILSRENQNQYWNHTLFKIKVFDLTQYDKIVFLDTDMIVLSNLDHLFDLEHMSAVDAGAVIHPEWKGGINSGLMIIKPDHHVYEGLVSCIEPAYRQRKEDNLGFGDQDIIKTYYKDWRHCEHLHLSECYNTMLGYGGCLKKAGVIRSWQDIKVYHYTGKEKPWNSDFKSHMIILFKIIKRAGIRSNIDFRIYRKYRKLLQQS